MERPDGEMAARRVVGRLSNSRDYGPAVAVDSAKGRRVPARWRATSTTRACVGTQWRGAQQGGLARAPARGGAWTAWLRGIGSRLRGAGDSRSRGLPRYYQTGACRWLSGGLIAGKEMSER